MINIRKYKSADQEAAIQLMTELQDYERKLEPKHFPGSDVAKKYWRSLLKNQPQEIFIAEDAGNVIGFCVVRIEHEKDLLTPFSAQFAYISDIIVSLNYRKQKIGTRLLEQAEKYARSQRVKIIEATALYGNELSQGLFNKNGYRKYEVMMLKEI